MQKNNIYRYINFAGFLISAALFIYFAIEFASDFHLVAIAFLVTSLVTLESTFFDYHIEKKFRITFYVLGILLLIISITGFILTETRISVDAYCIVYAVMEIGSGLVKVYEGSMIIKAKNKMGYFYVIDGIIEIVLGTLMAIEQQEGLRTHLIFIAADKIYEGLIKFINSFVEDKLEKKEQWQEK